MQQRNLHQTFLNRWSYTLITMNSLSAKELEKIYKILRAIDEKLITNPSEEWELDYYEENLIDKKDIKIILKKIEKQLSKDQLTKINKPLLRRKYHTFNNEIDERVYRILEKAFNEQKTVEIGYFNMKSAEVKKREIDIYHKTRKYITAFCHLRNAERVFRTSRITSTKITDKSYHLPEKFQRK